MIDFRFFQYAGPPRTGSTWVLHAAHACGLGQGSKSHVHLPFEGRWTKFRVITVRNPCDWLVSYWSELYPGKMGLAEVDVLAELPGQFFDEFIQAYLKQCPGQVGRIFSSYNADTCLRLEDFPISWMELLSIYRVPYVLRQKAMEVFRINSCRFEKPTWPIHLRRQVAEAEWETMERFDYR